MAFHSLRRRSVNLLRNLGSYGCRILSCRDRASGRHADLHRAWSGWCTACSRSTGSRTPAAGAAAVWRAYNRLDPSAAALASGLNFSRRRPPRPRPSRALAALKALAADDPGRERLQRPRQRLDLRIWQQASGSENHSSPSGSSRDSVASSGLIVRTSRRPSSSSACRDSPASPETASRYREDDGNRGVDIGHNFEQCGRFRPEGRDQREFVAADRLQRRFDHFRRRRVTQRMVERLRRRQVRRFGSINTRGTIAFTGRHSPNDAAASADATR